MSELLEQTRVIPELDSAREISRDDKDVYDYGYGSTNENADLDGPINSHRLQRSASVESGLTKVQECFRSKFSYCRITERPLVKRSLDIPESGSQLKRA